jgi:hypothetical protein
LSKLLIGEVSGVDDPANLLRGWVVAKSRGWNYEAAEARVRKATGADDAPTPAYASCFLWNSGEGEDLPEDFGAYKFLVADATTDGELVLSLDAVRAVKSILPNSELPEDELASVSSVVEQLETAMVEEYEARKSDTSIVGKLKALLTGKEDIDMTKEELQKELDERFASLDEKLETLSKSVEAPAPAGEEAPADGETAPEPTASEDETVAPVASISAEDISKAVEEALEPVIEAISKTLDRVAVVEERLSIRKSLDGQEDGETGEPQKPNLSDAMKAAFSGRAVTLS